MFEIDRELASVKVELSSEERLNLVKTLYELPKHDFDALLFALDVPSGLLCSEHLPFGIAGWQPSVRVRFMTCDCTCLLLCVVISCPFCL